MRVRRFSNEYRVGATLWLTSKRIAGLPVNVSCFLFGKELLGHKTSKEKALGFSHFHKKFKFSNNTTLPLLIYMAGKCPVGAPRHQGNPLIRDMVQMNLVPVSRSVRISERVKMAANKTQSASATNAPAYEVPSW